MRLTLRTALYLILDCFLLVTSLVNVPSVVHRPGAPFDVVDQNGAVLVETIHEFSACGAVQTGDVLVAWEGKPVPIAELIEYSADRSEEL